MNKSVVKFQVTIPRKVSTAEAMLLPRGQLQKSVLNASKTICDSTKNTAACACAW